MESNVVPRRISALKSIVWRIAGVIILALITFTFTRKWITTTSITLVHHGVFLVVFYLHERIWLKIGRFRGCKRAIMKSLIYEILLGMGIGGLIVLLFTGRWLKVGQITLTYTFVKLFMYVINERIWHMVVARGNRRF